MSTAEDNSEGEDIRCGSCGYQWVYTGDLWRTTCPRCGAKTDTPLKPEEP